MKKFVTGLMVAATLTGGLVASVAPADAQYRHRPGPYYYHHDRGGYYYRDRGGDAAAAAALGVVGGMILGGALAQSSRTDYVYEDDYAYRQAPRRVYEEDYRRPSRGARCRTFIKYDMYGKPYEFKDCDP